jgi:hypothetical protein
LEYTEQFSGLNPVAIKKGQSEINAPEYETWGTVTCDECSDEFLIGPNRVYADHSQEGRYVNKLTVILADEHGRGASHQNSYDLGW